MNEIYDMLEKYAQNRGTQQQMGDQPNNKIIISNKGNGTPVISKENIMFSNASKNQTLITSPQGN